MDDEPTREEQDEQSTRDEQAKEVSIESIVYLMERGQITIAHY